MYESMELSLEADRLSGNDEEFRTVFVLADWGKDRAACLKGKRKEYSKGDQLKDVVWQEGKGHVEEMQSRTDFFVCVTN